MFQMRFTLTTNPSLTKLVMNLRGLNPENAINDVPYQKGGAFMWYLEEILGGTGKQVKFP